MLKLLLVVFDFDFYQDTEKGLNLTKILVIIYFLIELKKKTLKIDLKLDNDQDVAMLEFIQKNVGDQIIFKIGRAHV